MKVWKLISLVIFTGLLAPGCGASQFEGGVYREGEIAYRVQDPGPAWERLSVGAQNDLAWHHPPSGAFIQVNASCDPALDIPLRALTQHLLIGFTEREIQSQERLAFAGREALQTSLFAKLDGVPRYLVLTVLKKDGCVYDFALVTGGTESLRSTRPVYHDLLRSFQTLESP